MDDSDGSSSGFALPPPLVALAGWLVPGAGYWLIGQRTRAIVVFCGIVMLYLSGLLVAGVRVIEVPGYDAGGEQVRITSRGIIRKGDAGYETASWALTGGGFLSEVASKPWFVGQVLAGPLSLGSAAMSIHLGQKDGELRADWEEKNRGFNWVPHYPHPHAPMEGVGTLYTAIAGMLNLMVIIDSAYRAGQPRGGT